MSITVTTAAEVIAAEETNPTATLDFKPRITPPNSPTAGRIRQWLRDHGNHRVLTNIEAFVTAALIAIDDCNWSGETESYELPGRYSRSDRPEIFYA